MYNGLRKRRGAVTTEIKKTFFFFVGPPKAQTTGKCEGVCNMAGES